MLYIYSLVAGPIPPPHWHWRLFRLFIKKSYELYPRSRVHVFVAQNWVLNEKALENFFRGSFYQSHPVHTLNAFTYAIEIKSLPATTHTQIYCRVLYTNTHCYSYRSVYNTQRIHWWGWWWVLGIYLIVCDLWHIYMCWWSFFLHCAGVKRIF